MQITEDIREYWNKRSSGFSDAILDEYRTRGETLTDTILDMTGAKPGSKVLDVGCGPGLLSMLLYDAGMEVVGIDYSEDMVRQATKNATDKGMGIEFKRMDAQNMEFADESFDIMVSRDVLWNLPEPDKAYREIVRILKPDGRGLIKDGNYYLGLSDERYDHRDRTPSKGDYHSRFNQDGVDFNIIQEIARNLPLSRQRRPAWDVSVLQDLNVDDIRMKLQRFESEGCSLVSGFSISFRKVGP